VPYLCEVRGPYILVIIHDVSVQEREISKAAGDVDSRLANLVGSFSLSLNKGEAYFIQVTGSSHSSNFQSLYVCLTYLVK